MALIEFHGSPEAMQAFAHPYPAAHAVPEWYTAMAMDVDGREDQPSLKRCPPFLEAMTAGYIIPVPADCTITLIENEMRIDSAYQQVSGHHMAQYRGAPWEKAQALKFLNPWIVKTPPGYSTLFVAPINRFAMPFTFFGGVVETDTYYRTIHFPFLSQLRPGQSFTLKAGTPLMQAIPFPREAWSSQVKEADGQQRAALDAEFESTPHAYKQRHWQKREFE